ncbi:uncharacterized protein LOC143543887 [Bidens hawaiensis]|uniref:uncharacterized protein LOC143543887 n=1 Tax=Bidens hawaiensis TaxID=980011 RepID=UPI00404A6F60
MMKSKPKQPSKKSCTQNDPEIEECVQDGWVVVKKQKVTILIPSLPITEQCTIPSIATKEVDYVTPPQPEPCPPVAVPLTTPKPVTTVASPPKLNGMPTPRNPQNREPNYRKPLGICNASKAGRHCGSYVLENPKMRALNLERKLRRAGGMNKWLVSIGLGQFVKLFRCKRVGKTQLVNLTMKKLKDMGADAVGPRRKLMHAIDCVW